jgi:hypothetical protein
MQAKQDSAIWMWAKYVFLLSSHFCCGRIGDPFACIKKGRRGFCAYMALMHVKGNSSTTIYLDTPCPFLRGKDRGSGIARKYSYESSTLRGETARDHNEALYRRYMRGRTNSLCKGHVWASRNTVWTQNARHCQVIGAVLYRIAKIQPHLGSFMHTSCVSKYFSLTKSSLICRLQSNCAHLLTDKSNQCYFGWDAQDSFSRELLD